MVMEDEVIIGKCKISWETKGDSHRMVMLCHKMAAEYCKTGQDAGNSHEMGAKCHNIGAEC